MNEIRYFSMFTGVGGFELGFEGINDLSKTQRSQQGRDEIDLSNNQQESLPTKQFTCVGFSEINKYASELLANKFPEIKNYGDATKIIPGELQDFDLLVGGFPCQAFSIAGKRKGFEDTRGTLFHEIVRILKVKRPRNILLENVKGLLSHNRGRTFATILASLSELGYVIQWVVLNSKFFGVPQNRERVFIIGSLRGERIPEILPFRESSQTLNEQQPGVSFPTVFASQHKIARGMPMIQMKQFDVSGKGYKSQQDRVYGSDGIMCCLPNANPDNKLNIAVLTPDREKKRQNGRRFKEDGEPSFTLTGQDVHGVTDGKSIRRLTPTECERLQGFPDGWTEGFSDTQRYKMMGNAVTVNVVRTIASRMFALDEETAP